MLKKIIVTLTSRILIAGVTLIIVFINAKVLGTEKIGTITQILLAVTIIQLGCNVIGGASLVYMIPRSPLRSLVVPSYIWSLLISASGTLILSLFNITRAEGYMVHVFFLSLFLSYSTLNLLILMGKERIGEYNIITVFQVMILLGVLLIMFYYLRINEVRSYLTALYFSYGIGFIASFILLFPLLIKKEEKTGNNVLKQMLKYGGIMQAANIFQFFNYRMSYFYVLHFLGKGPLGIFSVGTSLSESLWILGRSISIVQYASIANGKDPENTARLTLTFIKICLILTIAAFGVLVLLLNVCFKYILPVEFEPIKYIMLILGAGIVTFSISVVLSPYFSGTGRPVYNTITSGIGLVLTLILGFILVPRYGLAGAAMSATISYSFATVYQLFVFVRISKLKMKDFVLKSSEIRTAYQFFISLPYKKIS